MIVPGRDDPWRRRIGVLRNCARWQVPRPQICGNCLNPFRHHLQHGLLSHRAELVKTLEADNGRLELRAVTGPDYGRIWDHELAAAVMQIAGNGTDDARWKVPGVLDWSSMTYNPFVDVIKDTMTLYAGDRNVLLFLVDDTNPIEAGRLPDSSPGNGSSPAPTKTGTAFCASRVFPKPRHRRSFKPFLARRTASRRASSISCRASRLLLGVRCIRTRSSSSKVRPGA
jgi:hypothetical protein